MRYSLAGKGKEAVTSNYTSGDIMVDKKRNHVFSYLPSVDAWLINKAPDNYRLATKEEILIFTQSEERIVSLNDNFEI